MLVDGRARGKSHKLAGGEEIEFELPEPAAQEPSAPLPELTVVHADEHLFVVDKPAGVVVHPGAGPRRRHARRTRWPPRAPRAGRRSVAASSTASTGTRRACSSSRAPSEAYQRLQRARATARADARVPRARRRKAALAARDDRRPDRPRPARPHPPLARHRHAARGRDALRARGATAAPCAAAGAARDRADAPDPRPPRRDRSSRRRRPDLRRSQETSGWSGSSCTRRASRSRTRSRASRSTSRRRCRPTSPPRWRRRGPANLPRFLSLLPGGPAAARVPLLAGGAPRLPPAHDDKRIRKELSHVRFH